MSTLEDEGFELLPADDADIPPDLALNAAAASATAIDDPAQPLQEDPVEPWGMSWAFDFEAGRFIQHGGAPAEVRGIEALRQRLLMAIHSARYAHEVFSDDFGMEDPDDLIGEVRPEDKLGDYERRIREAILAAEPRVSDVTDFSAVYDPTEGVLTIETFTVITDEDEEVPFTGIAIGGT